MKWIFNDSGSEMILLGSVVPDQSFYQIEQRELLRWQTSEEVETAIASGDIVVSFNGSDLIADVDAGLAFLRSFANFPSTWAVDKFDAGSELPVDQTVTSTSATLITAERCLWDLLNDVDLSTSSFVPKLDGIWNLNGTITLKDFDNAEKVAIDIYRNNELWFTVVERLVGLDSTVSVSFSCDIDAYASYSHVFDIRLRMEKVIAINPISATISGLQEETAWGMTFLQVLRQTSPT